MNILFLADEIKYTSGVTTHLYNLISGLKNYPANNYFLICGCISAQDKFNILNIPVIANPNFSHAHRNIRNFFGALIFLRQYCKNNDINIIHSHTHYTANIAFHTSYTVNVKTVQTNHGILAQDGKLNHFKAHKYIAINEHIYDYLLNNKIAPKSNIRFIRCGIPVPEKQIEKKTNGKLKFIAASRFIYDKGLDVYIKAISLLPDEYKKKAEFYIAGQGELENELLQMNDYLNAGIIFLGDLRNMNDILSEINVFIYSSRTETEGFPAVITEAAACGNLIITSDFYGLRPVFQDKENGLIFKVNDEKDLCEKIKFAVDNYEKLATVVKNFYSKVKILFDFNEMIQKHIRLYEECLRK